MKNSNDNGGFKSIQELLADFLQSQYETAPQDQRSFWAQTADKVGIKLNEGNPYLSFKTVVARVVYDRQTHEFLGFRVEDTDNVHADVGDDPFAYASDLYGQGYIPVDASCFERDDEGKPLMFVFRFARNS